jgi:pimeloyl-ACP methyl ester carboxylesterase
VIELHREVRGDGPPVVILHGLFGSLANWRSVARSLSDRFTVYSVDLRNHGRSPWDPVHTYSAMTCDLAGLLDEEGIATANVIGHSMGGKVAMNFALTYPDRVERLVVVDIGPERHDEQGELHSILHAMLAIDLDRIADRDDAESALRVGVEDPSVRSFLLMNLRRRENGSGFRWRPNLRALEENWSSLAAGVTGTVPWRGETLFIRGGRSDYLRPESEARISRLFPQAEIVSIDGAGHWVQADAPDAFVEVVSRFLERAPRNRGALFVSSRRFRAE